MFNRKSGSRKASSSSGQTSEFSRLHEDGELICREGEISGEMYVIQSGEVCIFKSTPTERIELATLQKGDFFGEMSLLEGLPRDASAQAIGETELLVMTSGALLIRLRRDPTFAFELLRRLSGRVRSLNGRLMEALEQANQPLLSEPPGSLLYYAESGEEPPRDSVKSPAK